MISFSKGHVIGCLNSPLQKENYFFVLLLFHFYFWPHPAALRGPNGMSRIKLWLATCKVKSLRPPKKIIIFVCLIFELYPAALRDYSYLQKSLSGRLRGSYGLLGIEPGSKKIILKINFSNFTL